MLLQQGDRAQELVHLETLGRPFLRQDSVEGLHFVRRFVTLQPPPELRYRQSGSFDELVGIARMI